MEESLDFFGKGEVIGDISGISSIGLGRDVTIDDDEVFSAWVVVVAEDVREKRVKGVESISFEEMDGGNIPNGERRSII